MSASGFSRDAAYSVFEAMRPGAGQNLDKLAVATYSLDLVAVAALVLSLSRAGEQELEAGPIAFVEALEALAPKMDIVYQKDRLRPAERHHGVLHLFDRRLHAVQPPRGASYHPKIALARYTGARSMIEWRLWLGSRNLTGGRDREAGLLLVGRVQRGDSRRGSEVAAMVAELLAPVAWVGGHLEELASVRWVAPEGVKLRSVQWRQAGEHKAFSIAFRGADSTVAVSPFVNESGCDALRGGGEIILLTTEADATALRPRPSLDVRVAKAPLLLAAIPLDPPAEPVEAPPVPDPPGIHAKMILRRRGASNRLWLGSANVTGRGLKGPNAEVLAEVEVPAAVAEDIARFVDDHPVPADELADPSEMATRAAELELDGATEVVLTARFRLERHPEGLQLVTDQPFKEFLGSHSLKSWLLTRPDAVAEWSSEATSVLLVPGGVPLRLETVLVCFSAARLAGDCPPRHWAQAVAFPGHDPEARDRAATAAYIGLSGASAWLRAQLEGIVPAEPATWTGAPRWKGSEHAGRSEDLPIALEEVLAAWARNPADFERRATGLQGTLAALADELAASCDDAVDAGAVAQWEEVRAFWTVVNEAVEGGHGT